MPAPKLLSEKSIAEIREELLGFPPDAIDAALAFREERSAARLEALILGMMEFYLPKKHARSLRDLAPETRFREDAGLDSLALAELVFKLDELLGVPIDLREAAAINTAAELRAVLRVKLGD